jgi:diguanylate cyclase (GGDEF)-like protein/PAS domain S-box-containing protein
MHNRLDAQSYRSTLPLLHPVDLGLALDNVHAGIMIMDAGDRIVYVNRGVAEMTGYSPEAATVWPPQLFQSLQSTSEQHQAMLLALRGPGRWCGEVLAQRKSGQSFISQLDLHALTDDAGDLQHYVAIFSEANRELLQHAEKQLAAAAPSPLLARLAQALTQDELVLYYQPKVNMRTGKVVGVEALLRWQHPESGLLLPGAFLPQAEHDDLIVDIGNWVIRQALAQIAAWHRLDIEINVSINIAARHLQRADFVGTLKQCLADQPDACPEFLEIEILESAALENTDHVQRVMEACREVGVSFSLDDFGTGYSSLAYLRAIPAEVLKIDRSFVKDLLDDSDDLILVEGVISLAKAFRREVVAEGVETAEHGLMLMRLGCDIAQGFGIARPMPAAEVPAWSASYQADPQWALWADIPWEMEDFPLLVAKYDHIGWVRRVIDFVGGGPLRLGQGELTDHHKCRFGHWYYHQGKARYGHLSAFIELEETHSYVHKLGPEIVRLHAQGDQTQALALAKELLDVRDNVLRHLDDLQRSVVLDPAGQHNLREKPMRLGSESLPSPLNISPAVVPRKSRQPFIYVIDDTPTNIELLAGALSPDFTIKFATNGAKALEFLAKTEKPDLILLDVMMPGMDGYEVCRHLKENPTTRGIPVIFITAKSEVADQARGFSLGAVDYIPKPFELPLVIARVRTHLNLKLRTDLLEAQASIDALTGIANRRRFDEALRTEWRRAARNIMPLSLLIFDVDHFKNYNDQYGHGAGDDCLRHIGEALQRAELRPGDFVARYGGEEFAVILPSCHSAGARAIAERIRGVIEGLQIRHEHSSCASVVTVSIGCATQKPAQGGDVSGLFLAADMALYRAKQEGRNRVCTAAL